MERAPHLEPLKKKRMRLGGKLGRLVENITDAWLLTIRETNPAILAMYRDTERRPLRDLLPWSGEFAGKYLTGAALLYDLTGDERLGRYLQGFADALLDCQQADGYLGPWPPGHHLTGRSAEMAYLYDKNSAPQRIETWDAWAHYHLMLGLLTWYRAAGDARALAGTVRIAELLRRTFYGPNGRRLWDMGCQDMNLAPIHAFLLLYRVTGNADYLAFAKEVEKDFEKPPAGDYIRCALAGQAFYETPKPRWESLHAIQGVAELYLATGEEAYKTAFEHMWWSIAETDVHNTGGFSTREQAIGTPFSNGQIETCCVIAHMAMSVDMLRLSGDPAAADMLEWATYNAMMGAWSPSGRWCTYNTPMEGYKRASYQEIGFQMRPGSPDLNCCSVNAPRAFGLLSDWAVMEDANGGLYVAFYGPSEQFLTLQDGRTIRIVQDTAYPYDGTVRLTIYGLDGHRPLYLRIPHWSADTRLTVNGEPVSVPPAASWVRLDRLWQDGDTVTVDFDMTLRFQAGGGDYAGKCAIFRGPLLLCFDPGYDRNTSILEDIPAGPGMEVLEIDTQSAPGGLFTCRCGDKRVTFCDLHAAGVSGTPYTTWFHAHGVEPQPFSRRNITRSHTE